MLIGLDPLLTPELLWVLASMGHGDDLALCDENNPVESTARKTTFGRPIRLPGVPVDRVARAILSVLPLDTFVTDPVRRMEVVGDPAAMPDVQKQVQKEIDRAAGKSLPLVGVERYAYYEAQKQAFAIIQAGDPRFYGCFLFRKGVADGVRPHY